jgi:uncharacterized protein YheU (UPF0270 family)
MIISHEKLSTEVLQALNEEFVTRDGTDTGYHRGRCLLSTLILILA